MAEEEQPAAAADTNEQAPASEPHSFATLDFSFSLSPLPPPPPQDAEDAAAVQQSVPTLEGTYFKVKLGGSAKASDEKLSHPLSGAGVPLVNRIKFSVDEPFVRWLVQEQGQVALSLQRPASEEGADPEELFVLYVDLGPLLFGHGRAAARYASGATPLTDAARAFLAEAAIDVLTSPPMLPPALAVALNPMSVSVVRVDGLPPTYTGNPYKAPFQELAEKCEHVYVKWKLLDEEYTTKAHPHASKLSFKGERKLILAGALGHKELCRRLREEPFHVEVHDRDLKPLPPPPPPPPPPPAPPPAPAPAEEEPPAERPKSGGKKGKADDKKGRPKSGGKKGKAAEPPPEAQPVEQPPPEPPSPPKRPEWPAAHGIARASLGALISCRSTQAAHYAPGGIPCHASRRQTLCLNVLPCERPRAKPEPEVEGIEYFQGAYVEHGTAVTVKIELAAELAPEEDDKDAPQLQRVITLINYRDTHALREINGLVNSINAEAGMNSASGWDSYKESGRDDLDIITGLQIADGHARLFLFEGKRVEHDESGAPLNGMARLCKLLTRVKPNSKTALTLMDSSLVFPARVYNTFEAPSKLIKLRMPLPQLILRPEVYGYLRVSDGARDAVLALAGLLTSETLRLVAKNSLFPRAEWLLHLDKRFGGAATVVDREGFVGDDDETNSEYSDEVSGDGSPSGRRRQKQQPRKAATDASNHDFDAMLARRAVLPRENFIEKNILNLPQPLPREPLPDWYLASIPQVNDGPVYLYSSQRLNQLEQHRKRLSETLGAMGAKGTQLTYSKEFLNADSLGIENKEVPRGSARDGGPSWSKEAPVAYLHDGTRSRFALPQPSKGRVDDLSVPWGLEEIAAEEAAARKDAARARRAKPRFDALPPKNPYFESNPEALKSIFNQTEEGIAAEHEARIDGAIASWEKKLVVDDPVMHHSMLARDKAPQSDRLRGMLHGEASKKAVKHLYRGKKALTNGDSRAAEPSIFMDESTAEGIAAFESSLRTKMPERWMGTTDFAAGPVRPKENLLATKKDKFLSSTARSFAT